LATVDFHEPEYPVEETLKAAFTAAEGWGSFSQSNRGGKWKVAIELAHGALKLREIRLPWLVRGNPHHP